MHEGNIENSSLNLAFPRFVQINLDGVLLGARLFEKKQSKAVGGPGGLVVNTASCAAFTFDMKFER